MLIVADLMELVVNPIFCDESFCVIMTLKFWPPGHVGVLTERQKWYTNMAAPHIFTKNARLLPHEKSFSLFWRTLALTEYIFQKPRATD